MTARDTFLARLAAVDRRLDTFVKTAQADALAAAAEIGLVEGALVEDVETGARYTLTKVEARPSRFGASICTHGVKLRRDGTWGSHPHYVSPRSLRVLERPAGRA